MINNIFLEVIDKLEYELKFLLSKLDVGFQTNVQEIRIRASNPIIIKCMGENYYVNKFGNAVKHFENNLYIVSEEQINLSFKRMCNYSIYAYQDQINNGFITLKGGHRVGICGTAIEKNNEIINITKITSLNIRICHFISHVADELISSLLKEKLRSILICGCPGSGKTTLLRDLVNQIADGKLGKFYNISVIDERFEIAYGFLNCPIDVFGGYTKSKGMMMALRTMSPDIIVCDEIGTNQEVEAISNALNSGVKFIATIHADSEDDVYKKTQIKKLLSFGAFDSIVILDSSEKMCKIKKNNYGQLIYLNLRR